MEKRESYLERLMLGDDYVRSKKGYFNLLFRNRQFGDEENL